MPQYFVTQTNNSRAVVGGVKMLKEFTTELVACGVGGAQINIIGQKLKIARFDENEIEVVGKIENVETVSSSV